MLSAHTTSIVTTVLWYCTSNRSTKAGHTRYDRAAGHRRCRHLAGVSPEKSGSMSGHS
jgi:hypothetical protein